MMKINCAHDELLELHKIIPNPKNPNKHPQDQIDRLAKLLDYQGQRHPIIVSNRSGFVVVGHGRLEAIKKLGWEKAAVNYQDFQDEAQEYSFIVSDNAIAEWADLDLSEINKEMLDLGPDFEIEMLGLKDFTIEPIEKFDPLTDEDEIPEVVHPITRKGDIWLLGNHRLMCGDSTMIDDVEKLMNGEKADMVFTDPPYGVDYKGINNDSRGGLEQLLFDAFSNMVSFLKNGASCYCFHSDKCADIFHTVYRQFFHFSSMIIWVKPSLVMGQSDYQSKHEPCLYGWEKTGKHSWFSDRKQTSVWEFGRDKTEGHTTPKPVEMISLAINNSSMNGSLVMDFFLGSGSTLIACESTSRKCYGMELDEKYCDVIINRWQNFTGKKATLELTGQTYEELKIERGDK
jgi:DNA modification methylase